MKSCKIKDLQNILTKFHKYKGHYWNLALQNVKRADDDPINNPYIRRFIPEQLYNFKKYRDEDI